MAKFDDILTKKKEVAPILDLSKVTISNREEFRKVFDKVPEFKIKSEKVNMEDIKIRSKGFRFKTGRKDYKTMNERYLFADPTPPEMRSLNLADLVPIPIDWKMLTTVRPKSKIDEDFYSRMIELGKAELKTEASDKRSVSLDSQIRKIKNKAGVVEMRVVSCKECGEDFCNGNSCTKFSYDNFARIAETPSTAPVKVTTLEIGKDKKKKKVKRKPRAKSHGKVKRKGKSKSPVKTATLK